MLIAGDASGDLLASELVAELRQKVPAMMEDATADAQPLRTALAPRFFGAGGPKMAAAGVELAFDLTQHSIIGFSDAFKSLGKFRRLFQQLFRLALERQPDVIIGVDFGGFNLRFATAIKKYVRRHRKEFTPWNPKLVQFVSPQVWASRPGRAFTLAENCDLLLSIFPFEKDWYARRVPRLRVKFVGHPMAAGPAEFRVKGSQPGAAASVVVLPGSRQTEIRRHWPLLLRVMRQIAEATPASFTVILPSEKLAGMVRDDPETQAIVNFLQQRGLVVELWVGRLREALERADVALAKSGTVTLECALRGVPAIVFYKTSWPTYMIVRQILTVKHIGMPNLLAGEAVYPEFIQHDATPGRISRAALELLRDESRRVAVRTKLAQVVTSLGGPGAAGRAAEAIVGLL